MKGETNIIHYHLEAFNLAEELVIIPLKVDQMT